MAFNVVTPDNLEYFKTKQDAYNIEAFTEMFAAKEHSHLAEEIGAAPLTHSHKASDIDGLQEMVDEKAAIKHAHNISDITGLQAELDSKLEGSHTHSIVNITGLQDALDAKANLSHIHAIADVTNLQTTLNNLQSSLNGKAALSHTHTASNISDLQSLLDAKANSSHTHSKSNITGLESDLSTINSNISSANTKINQSYSLKNATTISSNADLDTMKTVGNYVCNLDTVAATISNSPTGGKAFALKVGDLLSDGKYPYQEITRYTDGCSWRRTFNMTGNKWNQWYTTSMARSRTMLWSGSWNAGSITVNDIQYYNSYVFYTDSGAMLIGFMSYDKTMINCYGILCPERNVMRLESATIAVSGTTLTRTMPRTWVFTGSQVTSADSALVITRIEGLL